jgi:hypothetical protein
LAGGFAQNYSGFDASTLTINGGLSNITTGFHNSQVYLNSGQINVWQSYQNATLSVGGGMVGDATLFDASVLNLSGGTVSNLNVSPGSVVHVTGGSILQRTGSGTVHYDNVTVPALDISGDSTTNLTNVNVQALTLSQTAVVGLNNDSTVNAIHLIEVSEDAVLQADNGHVETLTARDRAWLIMNGIDVDNLQAYDASRINFIDGYLSAASLVGRTELLIQGGQVDQLLVNGSISAVAATVEVTGGTIDAAELIGKIEATITGGSITSLDIGDQVNAIIGGGIIGSLNIRDQSVTTVVGGDIEPNTIRLFGNGLINLYGNDLSLNPDGVGSDSFGTFTRFLLSGTLANGDTLDSINLLTYDGALAIGDPNLGAANPGSVRFFPVPELSTFSLTLLAMATAGLRLYKGQRGGVT